MREQYENNNPESKGVHIDMMKFPYTHQARNMYTFSQSEKIFKKDSYHDKLIDEIFDVLSKGKPEKQTERELRDLLSGE